MTQDKINEIVLSNNRDLQSVIASSKSAHLRLDKQDEMMKCFHKISFQQEKQMEEIQIVHTKVNKIIDEPVQISKENKKQAPHAFIAAIVGIAATALIGAAIWIFNAMQGYLYYMAQYYSAFL